MSFKRRFAANRRTRNCTSSLFQMLAVQGEWEKALTQLNVSADLDAGNLLMAEVCRPAIAAEALRAEIFAGKRSPLFSPVNPPIGSVG